CVDDGVIDTQVASSVDKLLSRWIKKAAGVSENGKLQIAYLAKSENLMRNVRWRDTFERTTFEHKSSDARFLSERELKRHDVNNFGWAVRRAVRVDESPKQKLF